MPNNKKNIDPTAFAQQQKDKEDKVAFAFVVLETTDGKIGMSEAKTPDGDTFKIDTPEAQLRVKRNCRALMEMINQQVLRSTVQQGLMNALASQVQKLQASPLVNRDGGRIIKR